MIFGKLRLAFQVAPIILLAFVRQSNKRVQAKRGPRVAPHFALAYNFWAYKCEKNTEYCSKG